MKRPLYYLLCAIACTSMVGATMPTAAIAEAIQPQATAEQQAQADATSSDTGKAEDGANANATADTAEDGTATFIGNSAANTDRATRCFKRMGRETIVSNKVIRESVTKCQRTCKTQPLRCQPAACGCRCFHSASACR